MGSLLVKLKCGLLRPLFLSPQIFDRRKAVETHDSRLLRLALVGHQRIQSLAFTF